MWQEESHCSIFSFSNANINSTSSTMSAIHVAPYTPPQQMWLTDSGATNHMTADLQNLSLATPFPFIETI